MIDIHSHFLPGVDDGARTLEESGKMLALAVEGGTRAIVATPHCDLRYRFDPEQCWQLAASLRELHPAGPRLYLGCELHLTPENLANSIAKPGAYSLNAGDCILLELPDLATPAIVNPAVEAFADSGLRVVIAHPERNQCIQRHMAYADQLVERGCYLQLSARSLNGGFGPAAEAAASYLLRRRLAHFIASDAHGATYRRPGLSAAFELVSKLYGEPAARILLIENPQAALSSLAIRHMPSAPGWLNSLFSHTSHGPRKPTAPPVP